MTTPIVRAPATDDELRECHRVAARGFNGPLTREAEDEFLAQVDPERALAVFVGDDVAAWSYVRPFGQFFGGRSVPMGGFSPVAAAPEHRGRGFGSLVTVAQLPLLRERGEVVAALYPAQTQLYRGNGFELGGVAAHRIVPTRSLHRLRPAGHVRTRRAGADDLPAVHACYRRFARTQPGWLDRPPVWWAGILPDDAVGTKQHVYVVDGAGDGGGRELAGYVRYHHRRAQPHGYTIQVEELCAEDPDVAVALWRMIGSSSTQAELVRVAGGPEHPLLLHLGDQDLKPAEEIRWMVRVVDVAGAIAARGFPPAVRARVDLRVTDRQCDWNSGDWRLTIEDGAGAITRGGGGDVALTINALSTLYSGYADARTLRQAGLVATGDDTALSALTAMFAGRTPTMVDFF